MSDNATQWGGSTRGDTKERRMSLKGGTPPQPTSPTAHMHAHSRGAESDNTQVELRRARRLWTSLKERCVRMCACVCVDVLRLVGSIEASYIGTVFELGHRGGALGVSQCHSRIYNYPEPRTHQNKMWAQTILISLTDLKRLFSV